jgi:hypothetical protein
MPQRGSGQRTKSSTEKYRKYSSVDTQRRECLLYDHNNFPAVVN